MCLRISRSCSLSLLLKIARVCVCFRPHYYGYMISTTHMSYMSVEINAIKLLCWTILIWLTSRFYSQSVEIGRNSSFVSDFFPLYISIFLAVVLFYCQLKSKSLCHQNIFIHIHNSHSEVKSSKIDSPKGRERKNTQ